MIMRDNKIVLAGFGRGLIDIPVFLYDYCLEYPSNDRVRYLSLSLQVVDGYFGFFLFYQHGDPVVVFHRVFMLDDFAVEVDMGDSSCGTPGTCEDSCTGQAYVVYVFQEEVDFVSCHFYEDAVVVSFREGEDCDGGYRDFCSGHADVYHVLKYSKTGLVCKPTERYK